LDTKVSEDLAASIFREAAMSSETMVSYCNTMWHHNAEDLNLNLHCGENLKPLIKL
jgi:hypothetical protein